MRLFCFFCVWIAIGACSKDDDPSFSSAEGVWTYTTPDGKIGVDFELKNNGTSWDAINPVIRVDGVAYNAEKLTVSIAPPTLGSIRINANDAKAVYAYYILLFDCKVNDSFTEIAVKDVTYTWPFNKTNSLNNVTVTRKQ